jgi:hypothetical protein
MIASAAAKPRGRANVTAQQTVAMRQAQVVRLADSQVVRCLRDSTKRP